MISLAPSKKGFTLIELLVVVAVVGLLAAIITAYLGAARNRGDDARRVSDIKQLQNALELYYETNGNYPSSLAGLKTGGHILEIPVPPAGGDAAYRYAALGSGSVCSAYHLGTLLEDASNVLLKSDADASAAAVCDGSTADFDGAAAMVYDVKF